MRIAILGWGSLGWCPKGLQFHHAADGEGAYMGWFKDGCRLPIEFARISSKGQENERLTLVIWNPAMPVRVLWSESSLASLDEARENLRKREGTDLAKIGYVEIATEKRHSQSWDVLVPIEAWAREKNRDAVIWTDLESNFVERRGVESTESSVVEYLRRSNATQAQRRAAVEYIRNAPPQIQTTFRAVLEGTCEEFGTA